MTKESKLSYGALYSTIIVPFDVDSVPYSSRDVIKVLKRDLDFSEVLFFK